MKARNMKHRVTIQQFSETTNNYGEVETVWSDLFTIWASIQTVTGKEQFLSNQIYSTLSHKLRIRFIDGITTKHRIKFDDRYFNILAVFNIFEANKEIEILAEEVI